MKGIAFIFITVSMMVLLCSCESKSHYRVLSFFFDGVPKPETEKTNETETGKGAASKLRTVLYMHPPYEAKICDGCHNPKTKGLVAAGDQLCFTCHDIQLNKKVVHPAIAVNGCRGCHDPHNSRYPSLLVAKLEEVCFTCHDENTIRDKHKGFFDTKCTECHNPHQSDNEHLLK